MTQTISVIQYQVHELQLVQGLLTFQDRYRSLTALRVQLDMLQLFNALLAYNQE